MILLTDHLMPVFQMEGNNDKKGNFRVRNETVRSAKITSTRENETDENWSDSAELT